MGEDGAFEKQVEVWAVKGSPGNDRSPCSWALNPQEPPPGLDPRGRDQRDDAQATHQRVFYMQTDSCCGKGSQNEEAQAGQSIQFVNSNAQIHNGNKESAVLASGLSVRATAPWVSE